jgi:molybdenum cofactor cytidylyltransferase
MPIASFRAFAIVPAAGQSRRMGRPKLQLPWGQATLIEQTLARWKQCDVDAIVVVVRPDDTELADVCRRAGADVVVPPRSPPHMRDSVQHALEYLERTQHPGDDDVWLLAPADMPRLSPAIVAELLSTHRPSEPAILTPTIGRRRGHPVLFPWPLAGQVATLAADRGIDALHWNHSGRTVACDHLAAGTGAFEDIDTLEEYEQSRGQTPPGG